ncbi:MAG: hypothetical protein GY943_14340 [Chloroflexi bacterium]|nr:hypothetical protein [Chloroflexota bacterium]
MTTSAPKKTSTMGPGCLIWFGLFWTGFSLIFVVFGFADGSWGGAIIGGLFALVGLGLTIYGGLGWFARYRLGKPTITFSNSTLRVGETFSVTYDHTIKSATQIDTFTAQLLFREIATYQQGTNTRTVTHNHEIEAEELPGGRFQSGHFLNETFQWQIPADGMHTLDVRRNKLKWIVKFELSIPKLPNVVEEYELTVLPEFVR